jgi:type IV secretion system protein VirB9
MNRWHLSWLLLCCPHRTIAQDTIPGDPIAVAAREVRAGLPPRVVATGGATAFPFGHGDATVACAILRTCVIALASGERILATTAGDSERWLIAQLVTGATGGTPLVAVKPTDCGIATNLVIVTDARVYALMLTAAPCTAARAPRLTPYVRFWYPDAPPPSPSEPALSFTYHWTHDAHIAWTPTAIYDDGTRVYIRFPAEARHDAAPVLWQETADGDRALLNYAIQGDAYVADHLFARAILEVTDGRRAHRVEIVNDR